MHYQTGIHIIELFFGRFTIQQLPSMHNNRARLINKKPISFFIIFILCVVANFSACRSKDHADIITEKSNDIYAMMNTNYIAPKDTVIQVISLGFEVTLPKDFSYAILGGDETLYLFNKNRVGTITSLYIRPLIGDNAPDRLFSNALSKFSKEDSKSFIKNKVVYHNDDLELIYSTVESVSEFDKHRDLMAILNKKSKNYYLWGSCGEKYWTQDSLSIDKIMKSMNF